MKKKVLFEIIKSIKEQATRHKRANDTKKYLVIDLEFIECLCNKIEEK